MSGDVQPRKRKDKKKKKDDLGAEEARGTASALGEGDVFMHSYHDHGTGGHWCAKIIFFSLLAVLVTLIGLIILENRGLTELEANSVESRYSGVLEGWIEDAVDDHHDEHTLELKHHDDDEDHPDEQLDENDAEEESLEEEIDHDDDDDEESKEENDEIEDDEESKEENDEIEDDTNNDDDDEDEEDDSQNDEGGDSEEDEIQNDDDIETHNDNAGLDDNSNEDGGEYDEEIEENLKDEDEEEEPYEHYHYEEVRESNNNIDENDDEDEEGDDEDMEEPKHDYISKEMTSHYNYQSYEDNGEDESKETRDESIEHNTEDEASEEDDQDDDDEQEIEKIEKEIDGDDSEEVDDRVPASKEKRESSKEDVKEEASNEDDEPPIEKISRPQAGKPFIEIEEEPQVKPVDTLAEEEAYERQQEELRRQEEEAPHSQGGGNSLEADWPGEPSDPYWRSQLDTAEEEFRQGAWSLAAARAGGAGLAGSGRARWLRAAALDRAAEHRRDNRLLADAVAAYLHLLDIHEALTDQRLLEAARRAVDRIQFRGTYLRAEPVYRLLIRRFPDVVEYRNNLTVLFLMANRADLADEVLRETLRLWPSDRVALAHHGFVLKTHYNKLEEAVSALRKALDGDAGAANEPRFYYHLGDALLTLGRFEEAHEVHKRGAELGHFLSPSQRSLYNVPRLRGRPWWRVEDTPYVDLVKALEASWRDILKEGEAAVALYEQEKEGLKERGEWSQLDIFVRGREVGGRCERAPAVCNALRGAGQVCRRGQVKFSMMTPGTHVRPHVGPTNCRLRMHLALSNTEGTYIRVDKEIRQWQLGKTFIFDDSFEHEVWHNGTGTRLVLIVDVWHPDLTAAERRQLPAI